MSCMCFYQQGGPTDKFLTLGKLVPDKGKTGKPKPSKEHRRGSKDAGGGQVKGRHGQEPHKPRQLQQDSSSPPSHHRSTGSLQIPKSQSSDCLVTISVTHANAGVGIADHRRSGGSEGNESKQPSPSPSLFYKQSGPSLSLFRHHKSHSVEDQSKAKLYQRRKSEPGQQVADRAAALTRTRLPSDPGLKVSEVDSQGETAETRFCLSPYATKAVRDYFSSHPRSNPQSGQQVALALMESRREWLRRCSDPAAEQDFDQLLFSEESYV